MDNGNDTRMKRPAHGNAAGVYQMPCRPERLRVVVENHLAYDARWCVGGRGYQG